MGNIIHKIKEEGRWEKIPGGIGDECKKETRKVRWRLREKRAERDRVAGRTGEKERERDLGVRVIF